VGNLATQQTTSCDYFPLKADDDAHSVSMPFLFRC